MLAVTGGAVGLSAVVIVAVATVASGASLAGATQSTLRVRRRLLPRPSPVIPAEPAVGQRRLGRALHAADLPLEPREAVRLAVGSVVVAGLLGLLAAGPAPALVAALVAAAAGPVTLGALRGRRHRRADTGLPAVLDDVARALRGGAAPAIALGMATTGTGTGTGPARADLELVVADVRTGLGLVESLERWAERRPTEPVRLAVGALAIGASTGGARSQAVEAVAATLRERQAVEREAVALATQARSSALVIALAPLGFAALSSLSDPRAAGFLLGTPVGLTCLVAGLALDGLGGWWMHRIVRHS